jgi:hypothetical protein
MDNQRCLFIHTSVFTRTLSLLTIQDAKGFRRLKSILSKLLFVADCSTRRERADPDTSSEPVAAIYVSGPDPIV